MAGIGNAAVVNNGEDARAPLTEVEGHYLRSSTLLERALNGCGSSVQLVKKKARKPCRNGRCIHVPVERTEVYEHMVGNTVGPLPGARRRTSARMGTGGRGEKPPRMLAVRCGLYKCRPDDEHHPYYSTCRLQSVAVTNLAQAIISPGAPPFAYDRDDPPVRSRQLARPKLKLWPRQAAL